METKDKKKKYKYTHDEFIDLLSKNGFLKEYKLNSEYIKMSDTVNVTHLKCGNTYDVIAGSIRKSNFSKCFECFGSKKKNIPQLQKEIDDIFGTKYIILNKEYTNNKMDLDIKCLKCENIFKSKPYRVTSNKNGCPFCKKVNKIDIPEAICRIRNKYGDNIIIHNEDMTNFSRSYSKFDIEFRDCNHRYKVKLENLLDTKKCRICNLKYMKSPEEYKSLVENITQGEYTCLTDYEGSKSKVKISHKKCNYEYYVYADDFLSGRRCPKCNKGRRFSEPVLNIFKILNENNIYFIPEYSFDDLPRKRFDVYIPMYDLLIEYDGEYHYYPIVGEDSLRKQIESDKEKDEFCKKINKKLIRIPYYEKNNIRSIIENIIHPD